MINCARGACVDSEALVSALKNKIIAGAASDVFEAEPPLPSIHPLLNAENHLCLPHIGFATTEAFTLRGNIVLENILNFIAGIDSNVIV